MNPVPCSRTSGTRRGQGFVQYALAVALIAIVVLASTSRMGDRVTQVTDANATRIATAAGVKKGKIEDPESRGRGKENQKGTGLPASP